MKKTDFDQDLIKTLRSFKTNENVNPSVFFRENTKVRLMNLISEEKVLENKSSFVFIKNPKFAFRLAGAFLIILVFISTGTILAAQSVNPKNSLYPVKLASEDIALKLSPSSFKANVAVEIAKRRGDEIASQEKTNSKSEIKHGIKKYKESIDQARILVPSGNTNLNHELEHEESNLDELTNKYKNSGQNENQSNREREVKGASDSESKQLELNTEEKSSEQKIQESPRPIETNSSQSIEKTIEETKTNVEHEIQNVISPQTSEESK